MKRYRVTARSVEIHAGVLQLTDEQAIPRAHRMEKCGKGCWRVSDGPVQFKVGEEFGYDGDLPKDLAADVEPAAKSPAARATLSTRPAVDAVSGETAGTP